MAIPREYATSNPVVRDELARIPLPFGTRSGDFVAPDFNVDAETVDVVTTAIHALNLDDLRAPDALAKAIRFESGTVGTLSVVERALKTTLDSRKIEEAGTRGVDVQADRAAMLRSDILDAKEFRTAQLATTAANFGGTHKDVTGLNFRTLDLYNKVAAFQEVIIADGRYPANRAVIGRLAWNFVRQNAEFNKFVAGPNIKGGARDLTLARFAEYLGLEEVRLVDYQRLIGNNAANTQFWPTDSFLLFSNQRTLSNRTFAATPVCPYGPAQGSNEAVDVRTAQLSGTELITEIGCYHRYISQIFNANLAFLVTSIVGV